MVTHNNDKFQGGMRHGKAQPIQPNALNRNMISKSFLQTVFNPLFRFLTTF
jgi:hypothetical protein